MKYTRANLKNRTEVCNDCIKQVQDSTQFYYVVVYDFKNIKDSYTDGECQICGKMKQLLKGHFMQRMGANETTDLPNHF